MSNWIDIGLIADIPRLGSRVVKTGAGDVAVFRTAEDDVFALRDRCPHKGGPLSQGIVHGSFVTCPLHNWVIELQSGEAQGGDKGCARRFDVKIMDGRVFLDAALMRADAA
jgi:nitrite reductase (NADH) small subunit